MGDIIDFEAARARLRPWSNLDAAMRASDASRAAFTKACVLRGPLYGPAYLALDTWPLLPSGPGPVVPRSSA